MRAFALLDAAAHRLAHPRTPCNKLALLLSAIVTLSNHIAHTCHAQQPITSHTCHTHQPVTSHSCHTQQPNTSHTRHTQQPTTSHTLHAHQSITLHTCCTQQPATSRTHATRIRQSLPTLRVRMHAPHSHTACLSLDLLCGHMVLGDGAAQAALLAVPHTAGCDPTTACSRHTRRDVHVNLKAWRRTPIRGY